MILIKNGWIEPVISPGFRGEVAIHDGRIVGVGCGLSVPEETKVIDAQGLCICPGFIDPHCHIGLSESDVGSVGQDENEHTSPLLPELRGMDSLNPFDSSFRDAREAGITACVTGPGSSGLITGQFCAVKTYGNTVEEMLIRPSAAMKFALGENPKFAHGTNRKSAPETRMSEIAMLREMLYKAKDYAEDRENGKAPVNMKLEALVPVVRGETPCKFHVHRADDIVSAIRIAREFSLRFSLDHCTEGYLIPDTIKEAVDSLDARIILGPLMMPRRKNETRNLSDKAPALFTANGIRYGLMSDHPVTPLQYLNIYAGLSAREGVPKATALRSVTLDAAHACWLDEKLGSIEPGKDADLCFFKGEPLSLEGKCVMTMIGGEIVFRAN